MGKKFQNLKKTQLNQIFNLIQNKVREDSFIDYKGSKIPNDIENIICSFLNNLGGHIVFGIEEKNEIPIKINSNKLILTFKVITNNR